MKGEREGEERRRAYAPRRLTSADRGSPRAYRRLLTVFQALGIEDDPEAQQQLARETYEYWVERRGRHHRQWDKDLLISYLKDHPEVLSHPELKRLQWGLRNEVGAGEREGDSRQSSDGRRDQS